MYTLNINFSRSNTLCSIMDCSGNTKFFYSAGLFKLKGRQKIFRSLVLKHFYKILILKLKFLRKKPLILSLKNIGLNNLWFLKKLRKKFFIVSVKIFSSYSYNGCRKKKIRRKKEEMAEWFKAADCKSVESSHRRFESCFLQKEKNRHFSKYNVVVACLLWEQKVMCSNHIISIFFIIFKIF